MKRGRLIPLLSALLLLGAAGCQEYDVGSVKEEIVLIPILELDPEELFFEWTNMGTTTSESFTLRNTGEAALEVSEFFMNALGDFALGPGMSSKDLPILIEPGASSEHSLLFTPGTTGERAGTLMIFNNDPLRAEARLPLSGEGLFPAIEIDPSSVSFGELYVGCSRQDSFEIRSVGTGLLRVDSITLQGDAVTLLESPDLPLLLEPFETATVRVESAPTTMGKFASELWVGSDDPAGYARAFIDYSSVDPTPASDDFETSDHDHLEVFMYIDQSGSMSEDQAIVRANASIFIGALPSSTEEWEGWTLMVATGDDGCHDGSLITSLDPDPVSLLQAALDRSRKGGFTEAGLTVATNGLDPDSLSGCNAGFTQENGLLTLILISDEPEQSPGSWSSYVETLQELDPQVIISAVAGPVPEGCSRAAAGVGYYEATLATGGVFLDFCSDWSKNLLELGETLSSTDRTFVLHEEATPESVRVYVNRIEWTTGWTFDPGRNAVVFDLDHEPPAGSAIHVDYLVWHSC